MATVSSCFTIIYLWTTRPATPAIYSIAFKFLGADFLVPQKRLPLRKSAYIKAYFVKESLYSPSNIQFAIFPIVKF